MGQITLTQIDDELLQAVAARAEATGRSVEEVIRDAPKQGLRTDLTDFRETVRRIRAMTPKPIEQDSTDMIRRMRDAP